MSAVIVALVSVSTGDELYRAELVGEAVNYAPGDDVTPGIIRRYRIGHPDATDADAFRMLAADGWSNGYLMTRPITTPA